MDFEADSGDDQKLEGSFDQPELSAAGKDLSAHADFGIINKPPTVDFGVAPK